MHDHYYLPNMLERIIICPGSAKYYPRQPKTELYSRENSKYFYFRETILHFIDFGMESLLSLNGEQSPEILYTINHIKELIMHIGHTNYNISTDFVFTLLSWGIPVYGTIDFYIINNITCNAHVVHWDLFNKTRVESAMRPQLLAYAAGAIGWPTNVTSISMHIVQPHIKYTSIYTISTQELHSWIHNILENAIKIANNPSPYFNLNIMQCKICELNNHCEAYQTLNIKN